MIRFRPDTKQICVLAMAAALALVSLMVPLDDNRQVRHDPESAVVGDTLANHGR